MKQRTTYIAQAALIAALYIALTTMFAPISFGEIQMRIAEALTILPLFTPAAIPGLFIGCLIGNITGGAILPDILLGSLTTLFGACGTYYIGKCPAISNYLGSLPPILANTAVIPFILRYGYGLGAGVPFAIPLFILTVGIGEVLSCGVLGTFLYTMLAKTKYRIFTPNRPC